MKLSDLCREIGGTLDGDDCDVGGVASLDEAIAGDVSFLGNPKYAPQLAETAASAVLVTEGFSGKSPCALVRVSHVDAAFAAVVGTLGPRPVTYAPGVHPSAIISNDAELGDGVSIGPLCVVEAGARVGAGTVLVAQVYVGRDVTVGYNCLLYPGATVREACQLGDRVILQPGAVIGSDGFGYAAVDGTWQKIPQVGVVILEDDVEIGANTTIDRARFGRTVVGTGTKLDNMVQIAHNVRIGQHTAMAAQVGIAGSTRIGDHVQLGGQSGAGGHIRVASGTVIGAQAGVVQNVDEPGYLAGFPAVDGREFAKRHAAAGKLPELIRRVRQLERELASLRQREQ